MRRFGVLKKRRCFRFSAKRIRMIIRKRRLIRRRRMLLKKHKRMTRKSVKRCFLRLKNMMRRFIYKRLKLTRVQIAERRKKDTKDSC